jgi:hypothetical protein
MTALELANQLNVSRALIYKYRKKYPDTVPASLDQVEDWRNFIEEHRQIATPKRSAEPKLTTQDWNAVFVEHRARERKRRPS